MPAGLADLLAGAAALQRPKLVVTVVLFVLIASVSIIVPVASALIRGAAATRILETCRGLAQRTQRHDHDRAAGGHRDVVLLGKGLSQLG